VLVRVGQLDADHPGLAERVAQALQLARLVLVPALDSQARQTVKAVRRLLDVGDHVLVGRDPDRARGVHREQHAGADARAVELLLQTVDRQHLPRQPRRRQLQREREAPGEELLGVRRRVRPLAGVQVHVDHRQALTVDSDAVLDVSAAEQDERRADQGYRSHAGSVS
jgi:hypothetical protein